ncbi:MAG: D-ribose ABC transporter substrate-binding protein [Anaerovoracaceae bacterium]|nr:D-ribose ABC transporter substrate-binding protein [Bacillota bacterium]MDY5906958.1 D-ribose ABC transporter substrate-binding protein [Anaerovoracaceae bacterium]
MKKKILAVVMAAAMVFGMTACGGTSNDAGSAAAGGDVAGSGAIGLAVSTQNNPFFVTLVEGAQKAADAAGVKLVVTDAGDDAAKQTNDVDDLISKKVSVLIVNPVDSDAIAPAVEDAIAAGIKVIAVDRAVNGVDVDCQIASDNVKGAEMATEYLKSVIGDGAKVAELQGTTGASATIDRGQGFHNIADGSLDVVASQTASFDRAEGLTVMENIIQSNGDLQGVFAHNDEMALGAIEAIEASGKDIKIVGFDATDDGVAAVKDGKMAATVAQQPDKMGSTAVETAIKLMNGETVEKSIPVEVTLVTE